jgi:hypothetical protein
VDKIFLCISPRGSNRVRAQTYDMARMKKHIRCSDKATASLLGKFIEESIPGDTFEETDYTKNGEEVRNVFVNLRSQTAIVRTEK